MATVENYDIPAVQMDGDRYDKEYKRSPLWDPEKGDFKRSWSGEVLESDGETGLKAWCAKIVATERFKFLAYTGIVGDQLGTELETAMKFSFDHATTESMIKRTVTEALKVNPRILSVGDFEFNWGVDSLNGSCLVTARAMDDFTLTF